MAGSDHRDGPGELPESILALPNLLTVARVPLGILMWAVVRDPLWALAVLVAAGASDMLDGWFARRLRRLRQARGDRGAYGAGTGLGAFLDPLCDKFFVTSTVAAIFAMAGPPAHVVLLILAREVIMFPAFLVLRLVAGPWRDQPYDFTAGWPGKLTTVAQFCAILLALLRHPWLEPVAWATGALGVFAMAYYADRAARAFRPRG